MLQRKKKKLASVIFLIRNFETAYLHQEKAKEINSQKEKGYKNIGGEFLHKTLLFLVATMVTEC